MTEYGYKISRRFLLKSAAISSSAWLLNGKEFQPSKGEYNVIKLGLIADLHQDIMHDGPQRLDAFLQAVESAEVDAIIQLGDFAYPNKANQFLVDRINESHEKVLHVIGNHEMDDNCTRQDCIDRWEMADRFYSTRVGGLKLIVLDGNDTGSPTHGGGYPSYVGPDQVQWLQQQLEDSPHPVVVFSHQPIAGSAAIDNAEDIQSILSEHADKVLLAVNGHTHIDDVLKVGGVTYMHVNSASYKWVGSANQHESYSKSVHESHPYIAYTCPYRDALFAFMTIDAKTGVIEVKGRESEWVGKSPGQLAIKGRGTLTNGEEIVPEIRDRRLEIVLVDE